jgi:hypothetical protein
VPQKTEIEKLESDILKIDKEIDDRKLVLTSLEMGVSDDGEVEDEELGALYDLRKKLGGELNRLTANKK